MNIKCLKCKYTGVGIQKIDAPIGYVCPKCRSAKVRRIRNWK